MPAGKERHSPLVHRYVRGIVEGRIAQDAKKTGTSRAATRDDLDKAFEIAIGKLLKEKLIKKDGSLTQAGKDALKKLKAQPDHELKVAQYEQYLLEARGSGLGDWLAAAHDRQRKVMSAAVASIKHDVEAMTKALKAVSAEVKTTKKAK